MGVRLAIAGATGLVGQKLLEIIARERGDIEHIGCFASRESAGKTVRCGTDELTVEALADCDFHDYDAAFFAIGDELSAHYAPLANAAGCAVVDKSNAFRMHPGVPLVVAGVNDTAIDTSSQLVANPNCSTIILMHALGPIEREFGISKIFATTYQSVSGAGGSGVDALASQISAGPDARQIVQGAEADSDGFAYNVVPAIGGMRDGRCSEERKLIEESKKILGRPELIVVAHAARVPVVVGHSIAVTFELQRLVTREQLISVLDHAPDVIYMEDELPSPLTSQQHIAVEVGRLRGEEGLDNGWSCFVSGDNINIGAALNGWRILQLMHKHGVVRQKTAA
jgi:aspartate-semialdehyde dehydrogenase